MGTGFRLQVFSVFKIQMFGLVIAAFGLSLTACSGSGGGGGTGSGSATSVRVSSQPKAIAIDETTNKIFIANNDTSDKAIYIVNGASGTVTNKIMFTGSSVAPKAIAVNASTGKVYAGGGDRVIVIDESTMTVSATITGFSGVMGIAVNPATNKVYVSDYYADKVWVVNGSSDSISSAITTEIGPAAIAVNATTNKIYVATTNYLESINGSNNVVTRGPQHAITDLAVDSTNDKTFGIVSAGGMVRVYDGGTMAVTQTYTLSGSPSATSLAIDSTGTNIFVADNSTYKRVIKYSTSTGQSDYYSVKDSSYGSVWSVRVNQSTGVVYFTTVQSGYGDLGALFALQ